MSLRNRLHILWAIVVLAPIVAVALLVAGAGGTADERAETRARQGLDTAFALLRDLRAEADRELDAVVADRRLTTLIARGPSAQLERRADRLVDQSPGLVAFVARGPSGRVVVAAGPVDAAVAGAGVRPVQRGGSLGPIVASTTTADELAARVRGLTGLDAHVARAGRPLASTAPEAASRGLLPNADSVELDGAAYHSAVRSAPEPAGPPVRLGVLAPADAPAPMPTDPDRVLVAIAIVLILVMVAAALLAFVLLRRRLDELILAARRLRSGDYRLRVPVVGTDRLAELAGELNALSWELSRKADEVESGRDQLDDVTRRVGDAFASGLDPDALIDLAVRTAVERCSADGGRAVPIDTEKMRWTGAGDGGPEVSEALAAAEREVFRVNPDEGRELLERLSGEGRGPRERTVARGAAVGGIHALAAPLRARVSVWTESEYLGVISIARGSAPFTEAESDVFAYLAAQAAVSLENAFSHHKARREAVTDDLTGLANARRFHEALARELERTRRFSTEVSLVMADIDDFKQVNDDFGHQQGDAVLVEVARTMRDQCREVDHVARYGGEEMALILPQTDLDGAAELAERVRRALNRKRLKRIDGGGELRVSASFGVAAVPESAADAQGLIAAADQALYRAKREGKNRVASAPRAPDDGGREGLGGEAPKRASV